MSRLAFFGDDGQQITIHEQVSQPHSLPIELRRRPLDPGIAELAHEIPVQGTTDVLYRRIILDDERFDQIRFLALRLEINRHEAEVVIDEILHRFDAGADVCADFQNRPILWEVEADVLQVIGGRQIDFVDGDNAN